jgi:hypothetical protein
VSKVSKEPPVKNQFNSLHLGVLIQSDLKNLTRAGLIHTAQQNLGVIVSERQVHDATPERLDEHLLIQLLIEHLDLAVVVDADRVGKVLATPVHGDHVAVRVPVDLESEHALE